MTLEVLHFEGANHASLPAMLLLPEEPVRAVLQITHGMTEHIARYEQLATALTGEGIAVAGFDLRGHGKNAGDPDCASFGPNGWEATLEDMHLFYHVLADRFPELPHGMLGFSLGSFLLREYLNRYDDPVAAAIIMGTGTQPGFLLSILKKMVKKEFSKAGFDHTTPLVQKLSFGMYNQKFMPAATPSDWLCSDENELRLYLADPLCRKSISAGLFWQLLDSMQRTGKKKAYANWPKDLPVLMMSGQDDPVGNKGKGVYQVVNTMKLAGLTHVELRLIPHARHDLIHECSNGGAKEAIAEIRLFLNRNLFS